MVKAKKKFKIIKISKKNEEFGIKIYLSQVQN